MDGVNVVAKHALEQWVPDNVKGRASTFVEQVRSGELDYQIYFTHGMFIAAVLMECSAQLIEVVTPFDEKRGYIPLQAAIVQLTIP